MKTQLKQDAIRIIRMLQYDADNITKDEIDTVLLALQTSLNYREVTSVHLDDLRNLGYLPIEENDGAVDGHITNLERIADKLSKDYQEQLFNISLDTIAEIDNVYHVKGAMETLATVCSDLAAYNFDNEDTKKAVNDAWVCFNYSCDAGKDWREWNFKKVLHSMEVMRNNLGRFGCEKTTLSYTNLINRVKELLEWNRTSMNN